MKKVMILGDTGLVGQAIIKQLENKYKIYGISRKKLENENWKHISFDLEKENILEVLHDEKPEIIISCTRGDYKAQIETHKKIAEYSTESNAKVYYFSTVNVFDDDPNSIKFEDDKTCSKSDYGQFKIECENLLIKELGDNVIIIRIPMVYGQNSLRVNEIRKVIEKLDLLVVYENMYFTTIFDTDLAIQLKYIIEKDLKGIFHLASKDIINYKDFYNKILEDNTQFKLVGIENYEKYYFAIKTKRKELCDFQFSNDDVVHKIRRSIYNNN